MDPGDTPAENTQLPVLLRGGDPGGQQAPGPAAGLGREHRPGPPPRRQRGAAGDHLDLPRRRAREGLRGDRLGRGRRAHARPRSSASGRRCCRRCRCTAATATGPRRSPSPATSSSSARSGRACRSRSRTRSSTRSSPRRSTSSPTRSRRRSRAATDVDEAVIAVVKDSYAANKPIIFGGDNYDEAWHAEAEQRGLKNLQDDARRAARGARRRDGRGLRQVRGALRARARVALRGLARAVHDQRQHRGRDRPRRSPRR